MTDIRFDKNGRRKVILAVCGAVLWTSFAAPVVAQGSNNVEQDWGPIVVDEYSTVTSNSDGTKTLDVFSEPVRFKGDDGNWHSIDTTLVLRNNKWIPKSTPVKMQFSNGGADDFAQMSNALGVRLSLGWRGKLPKPVRDGNTLTYANVLADGGDLSVSATPTGFSHSLILPSEPISAIEVPIDVTTPKSVLRRESSGGLSVRTGLADENVSAPAPTMWGADHEHSSVVLDYDLEKSSSEHSVLMLQPSDAFLHDSSTKYPVTIDPTFALGSPNSDTFVENTGIHSTSAGHYGWDTIRVGSYDNGVHAARAFLNWPLIDLTGKDLQSASLMVRNSESRSCSSGPIYAGRILDDWSAATMTWNNQPAGAVSTAAPFTQAFSGPSGCLGVGWAKWNVLDDVKAWQLGAPQNGFRLYTSTETLEGYRVYDSANEAEATYRPRLSITYAEMPNFQEVVDALNAAAEGSATQTQQDLISEAGLSAVAADGSSEPEVVALDEDDPSEEDSNGVDTQLPGEPSCNLGTDLGCVSGEALETENPEVTAGRVLPPQCANNKGRARRYTVTMRYKSLLGSTIYRWSHRVRYCTKSGLVTRWRERVDWLPASQSIVEFEKLSANSQTGIGAATATSMRQRTVKLCVLKYGCYSTLHPWSELRVRANGAKNYKGRSH